MIPRISLFLTVSRALSTSITRAYNGDFVPSLYRILKNSRTSPGREYLSGAFVANKPVPFTFAPGGTTNSPSGHEMSSPDLHSGYVTVAEIGSPVLDRSLYPGASSRKLSVCPGTKSAFRDAWTKSSGVFGGVVSPRSVKN